jgi:hypothetical protein
MRETSPEIVKLCETCRDNLAHSSLNRQQGYARELLELLEWKQPIPLKQNAETAALSAVAWLLRAGGQTAIAACFVPPGTIDPPTSVIERGLDFCRPARLLVNSARAAGIPYIFISDMYRAWFYDTRMEDLILYADEPRAFNAAMAPHLTRTAVERGALEEVRRNPRSAIARHFREWRQHWQATIERASGLAEERVCLVLDRLMVTRYLFSHDILRRTRSRLQQRFEALTEKAWNKQSAGCGRELIGLFHDMWLDWRIDLFKADPELDKAIEDDALAARLIGEFALLSRNKFSIATILESFNYGDPSEKMRVRMVPDINEDRELYLAKQTLDTIDEARIVIDLPDEGYRAIFHWFDKVVALYERLDMDFESTIRHDTPAPEDIDLFAWSEMNSGRPEACADRFAHACEHGFGIYYSSPRQLRIARLLLVLHLISRYDQERIAVDRLPALSQVFMKRPQVLPKHFTRNPEPPIEDTTRDYDSWRRKKA